jgi:TPR repeat protein
MCLLNGLGVRRNIPLALSQLESAASQGEVLAMHELGDFYRSGGVSTNWRSTTLDSDDEDEDDGVDSFISFGERNSGAYNGKRSSFARSSVASMSGSTISLNSSSKVKLDLPSTPGERRAEAVKWYKMAADLGYGGK